MSLLELLVYGNLQPRTRCPPPVTRVRGQISSLLCPCVPHKYGLGYHMPEARYLVPGIWPLVACTGMYRNHEGDDLQSCIRNHGEELMEEALWVTNHEAVIMEEELWKSNHGGAIIDEESCAFLMPILAKLLQVSLPDLHCCVSAYRTNKVTGITYQSTRPGTWYLMSGGICF